MHREAKGVADATPIVDEEFISRYWMGGLK